MYLITKLDCDSHNLTITVHTPTHQPYYIADTPTQCAGAAPHRTAHLVACTQCLQVGLHHATVEES